MGGPSLLREALTNSRRPRPAQNRGPRDAAASGAGPAGDRRRPPRGLGAVVAGATRLVGPEAGAEPGSRSRAAGEAARAREAAAGAMAAPIPGLREVGADPREDRRGKGWGTGAGLLLPRHTPVQAQEGPALDGDQDTPHMGLQV